MSNRNPFDEMIAGIDALSALRQDMLARAQARVAGQADRRPAGTEARRESRHEYAHHPAVPGARSHSH